MVFSLGLVLREALILDGLKALSTAVLESFGCFKPGLLFSI